MKKLLFILLCLPLIGFSQRQIQSESLKMHELWVVDSFIDNHYSLFVQHINTNQKQIISSLHKGGDGKYVISFLNFDDDSNKTFVTHVLSQGVSKNYLYVLDLDLLEKKSTFHSYRNLHLDEDYEHDSYENDSDTFDVPNILDTNIHPQLLFMHMVQLKQKSNKKECWDNNGNIIKCKEESEREMSRTEKRVLIKALIVFCGLFIVALIKEFRKKEKSK